MRKLTILIAVLALALIAGPVAADHLFADVADGADGTWLAERHDAVDRLASDGIVTGKNDGTFGGTDAANRNQFALWMDRAYRAWIAPLADRVAAVECSEGFEKTEMDVYVQGQVDDDPEFETGWLIVEACADRNSFVESDNGAPIPPETLTTPSAPAAPEPPETR